MKKFDKMILKVQLSKNEEFGGNNILTDIYLPISEGEGLISKKQYFFDNEKDYEIVTKIKIKKKEEVDYFNNFNHEINKEYLKQKMKDGEL